MSSRIKQWDGSYENADKEDNLVKDFIEHGKILREPTIDGYTHDIVDRGGYISDEYYFPDKDGIRGNGYQHHHFEFHSDGDVWIDGTPVDCSANENNQDSLSESDWNTTYYDGGGTENNSVEESEASSNDVTNKSVSVEKESLTGSDTLRGTDMSSCECSCNSVTEGVE